MTADVDRALLVWPLVVSLVTTFGTTGFVLLSAGEPVFNLPASGGFAAYTVAISCRRDFSGVAACTT